MVWLAALGGGLSEIREKRRHSGRVCRSRRCVARQSEKKPYICRHNRASPVGDSVHFGGLLALGSSTITFDVRVRLLLSPRGHRQYHSNNPSLASPQGDALKIPSSFLDVGAIRVKQCVCIGTTIELELFCRNCHPTRCDRC